MRISGLFLSLTILWVLLLPACNETEQVLTDGTLTLNLELVDQEGLPGSRFVSGEPITLALIIENLSARTHAIAFGCEPFVARVVTDGVLVWGNVDHCMAIQWVELAPGEATVRLLPWDQTVEGGEQAPPGTYWAHGEVLEVTPPGRLTSDPVTFEIQMPPS